MSDLRQRISAAAQDLYLSDGVEGVSMRKVAERVGVSAPAIYRHFENKDALLDEIVVEGLRTLERYLSPALEAPTAYDRLRALIDRYLEFTLEQPRYFDFAFLVPSRTSGELPVEIAKRNWVTFKLALDQVAACMDDGTLRKDDPMETAVTIWSQVHGLVILFRTGRFGQEEQVFRTIFGRSVDRLLQALGYDA